MGRTRRFDESAVVAAAAEAFRTNGYEGTGVDELLRAVGLNRGSLYQAFGSKRGIFLAALRSALDRADPADPADTELDLMLVALLELAPRDAEIRALLASWLADGAQISDSATILGSRLLVRAGVASDRQTGRARQARTSSSSATNQPRTRGGTSP